MSVKQKLFLLLVAGFLITAPTLADGVHVDPGDPTRVANTSGFGTLVPGATDSDSTGPPPFQLTLEVEVFYGSGVYTYVYKITHDATVLLSLQILNNLYDGTLNWGWVGDPASDPMDPLGPFGVKVDISHVGPATTFQFDDFQKGMLTIYIQSTLPPTMTATEFVFGSGDPEGGTGYLLTLGPTDQGGGASFGVPEPSSLFLLAFGLLSGGVLRFGIKRTRG